MHILSFDIVFIKLFFTPKGIKFLMQQQETVKLISINLLN